MQLDVSAVQIVDAMCHMEVVSSRPRIGFWVLGGADY